MDNCRFYVCNSDNSECIKFYNIINYFKWLKSDELNIEKYIFYPICNSNELYDKIILSYRNKKIVKIIDI